MHFIIPKYYFKYYNSQVNCNLLGHTPGTMAMSSMAMLPKLFLPTVPSNTICNNKKTLIWILSTIIDFLILVYLHIKEIDTLYACKDEIGAWPMYQLFPASPLRLQIFFISLEPLLT